MSDDCLLNKRKKEKMDKAKMDKAGNPGKQWLQSCHVSVSIRSKSLGFCGCTHKYQLHELLPDTTDPNYSNNGVKPYV